MLMTFILRTTGSYGLQTDRLFRYDPQIKMSYLADYDALIRQVTVNDDSVIYNGYETDC